MLRGKTLFPVFLGSAVLAAVVVALVAGRTWGDAPEPVIPEVVEPTTLAGEATLGVSVAFQPKDYVVKHMTLPPHTPNSEGHYYFATGIHATGYIEKLPATVTVFTSDRTAINFVGADQEDTDYVTIYYPARGADADFRQARFPIIVEEDGKKFWRFLATGPEYHHKMDWTIQGDVDTLFQLEHMRAFHSTSRGQFTFLTQLHAEVGAKARAIHRSRYLGWYHHYPAQAHAHKTVKTAFEQVVAEWRKDKVKAARLKYYRWVLERLKERLETHDPVYRWNQPTPTPVPAG